MQQDTDSSLPDVSWEGEFTADSAVTVIGLEDYEVESAD